jgi:hypothetical protein
MKTRKKYLGITRIEEKAEDEGQLPDQTKNIPTWSRWPTQENREDKEINGIKDYPANSSSESLELFTLSCSS